MQCSKSIWKYIYLQSKFWNENNERGRYALEIKQLYVLYLKVYNLANFRTEINEIVILIYRDLIRLSREIRVISFGFWAWVLRKVTFHKIRTLQ